MGKRQNIPIVGMSLNPDSFQAGKKAAQKAGEQMECESSANWILAFCGGRHDPEVVLEGIRLIFGDLPIVGGSAVGTITSDDISYEGYECGLLVFSGTDSIPSIVLVDRLKEDEWDAGRRLGLELEKIAQDNDSIMIFYDTVRSVAPPVLNVASRLMDGLYESLGNKKLNIFGAGLVADLQLSSSFIFDGQKVVKDVAMAVVLPSTLAGHTTIMHGCTPLSFPMEITRVEGPVIYELDGQPALQVLEDMTRHDEQASDVNLSLTVALGAKIGDPYAPYDESLYVNRLIVSTNPEDGSVTLFEADFKVGAKVQIMSRDNRLVLDSVRKQTQQLLDTLDPSDSLMAFYIDCAGRTCAFCGAETEEAAVLQEVLKDKLPLFGFYSGVELAPFLNRTRPLDWSGVLTIFRQRTPHE